MENIVCSSLRIDRKTLLNESMIFVSGSLTNFISQMVLMIIGIDAGANNPEFEINNLVDSYMYKIFLVIKQEYFDLHDCDIYDELYEFVNNDLYDIYEGKVSYAYRFEAIPDGNPTTSEDYSQAMNRLNSIIEKYI